MRDFRKGLLLYNPVSGVRFSGRKHTMADVATLLRYFVQEIQVEPTQRPGSAGRQAAEAIRNGCEAVFVCGGDGTVFDALQGVVGTEAALGVIPSGTGNVLATDLGLPRDTMKATRCLLGFRPRRVAVGRIVCNHGTLLRYFSVAGGVGVHAEMVYRSSAKAKQAGGVRAYYFAGFDLLFRHRFIPFEIEACDMDGQTHRETVLEMMGMRVSSFGGMLSRWHPGSALHKPHLQVVVLRRSNRLAMLRYAAAAILGLARPEKHIGDEADFGFLPARRVVCRPLAGESDRIKVQADGELLGYMPAEIEIVPDALTLLMPPQHTQDDAEAARAAGAQTR